jgi:drug/metabolite transporter (DMT)-like permease
VSEPTPSSAADSSSSRERASSRREVAKGRWLVFAATAFWGTSATLARFMFRDHHVPPLTVVELRLVIAVLMLGPYLALRRPSALRIHREDILYFLVLGLFGVAAIQGSYYFTISVLGVGLAILLQYLAPSLIVAYDALRGARVGVITIVSVAAALAGTALLVGNVDPTTLHAKPLYWVIGFGSAFVFAFYILFSKRALRRYAPETVLLYTFGIAAIFWAIITPPWTIVAAHYSRTEWLLFVVLGITSALVPFAFFYAGLRRLAPAEAGIVATLEPVVAVLSAAALLHEGLRPLQWLGAALVLVASMLASNKTGDASSAERL